MRKIVISNSRDGFLLSEEAIILYCTKGNRIPGFVNINLIRRDDPILVEVVEELKEKSKLYGNLGIVEILDDVEWKIEKDDGIECVVVRHFGWYSNYHKEKFSNLPHGGRP